MFIAMTAPNFSEIAPHRFDCASRLFQIVFPLIWLVLDDVFYALDPCIHALRSLQDVMELFGHSVFQITDVIIPI